MQRIAQLVVRHLFAVEVTGQEILVRLHDGLHQLLTELTDALRLLLVDVRDGLLRPLQHLPVEEIDRRAKALVLSDRHVKRDDADAVSLAQLAQDLFEVGVLAVEPADDHYTRCLVIVELAPDELRADLDPGGRVDHDDRRVRHAHGCMLIAGEIEEARRVEQVDLRAVVREGCDRGVDGDAAFLFFGVRVEDACRVIDLAEAVRGADGVEQALDEGRFPRSAVPHDPNIADLCRIYEGQ